MDWAPRAVRTADGRNVGYRRAGSGPPVALLRASPRSPAVLVPLGQAHPWEAELRSPGTDLTVTTSPDDRGSANTILSLLGT